MRRFAGRTYHIVGNLMSWLINMYWSFIVLNNVLVAYATSGGSGEPAHSHKLARTLPPSNDKVWMKMLGEYVGVDQS